MEPVNLFKLASQQANWLSVRQAAVAGNIANVNTPGYKAVDVEPFEQVLDKTRVTLQATQVGHLRGGATGDSFSVKTNSDDVAMMPSENSVVLENELMNAGEISRSFELNTAIVKAFHRMITQVARG